MLTNNNPKRVYAAILFCFLTELIVFDKLRFFGVRPEFLLIGVIFFSFHSTIRRAATIGVIAGMLKDIFSVGEFGVNVLSFLSVALFSSALKKKLFRENAITQFIFSILAVYFTCGIYLMHLTEITGNNVSAEFWEAASYKAVYTGTLAPFLFFSFMKVFKPK